MTLFEEERPKTRVQWVLGNQCNYHCSYCHEMFHKGTKHFPSEDLIAEVCKDITYHFDDLGRDVVFEFIGGEPTIGGDVKKIAMRLHNHPMNMVLKTNGSASLEWWEESKKYLTDVVISAHKEYCNLDHIDAVISLLLNNDDFHPVNVKLLIPATNDPRHWRWAISTRNRFQKKYNLGEIQLLFSNFTKGSDMYLPYTHKQWNQYFQLQNSSVLIEEEKETDANGLPIIPKPEVPVLRQDIETEIYDPKFNIFQRGNLNYEGYKCYAGIDTFVIDYNGKVWRGWCSQGGPIGSIYELPIEFPTDPIVCGTSICSNSFDHIARKER